MNAVDVIRAAQSGLLQRTWGAAATALSFLFTVAVASVAVVLIFATRSVRCVDVLGRIWGRGILKLCGVEVTIEGLEHVDLRRSYVIVSNHLGNFDIFATIGALPLNIRFVAKKELTRIPVFGQALLMSDHIVIDRANPERAIERINRHVATQGGKPMHILFYAEGTRSPDGKIHEFKRGAVNLAIRTGLPLLPLSVSGTRKFQRKESWLVQPGGKVKLVIGKPIETKDVPLEHRDGLNERVRQAVVDNFIEDF